VADDVEIMIRPTGPYIVRGRIRLKDASGTEFDLGGKEDIALCRCGASTTKPFCDGTHSKIGFLAATEAQKESD
jgi:CDGSH-type Zn-finger protein